jgi:cation diffusion facilitator family transporter
MEVHCQACAGYLASDSQIAKNQRKIKWVVGISLITMIGEVWVGYRSGSMSLVAEGWHMGSHVGALSITLLAYWLAHSPIFSKKLSFGPGKLFPLGGYTSAVILGLVALFILIESVGRFFSPVVIEFDQALAVAATGLVVNVVSAFILKVDHHHGHVHVEGAHAHHHVHDHNIRSAMLHVSADAVTALLALLALALGKFYQWNFFDPVVGMIGAGLIFVWAFQLCKDTAWELLDGHSKSINWPLLRQLVETDGTRIVDFHIWRIAPQAIACELIVQARVARGSEYYRKILAEHFSAKHVVVEERT